MELSRRQNFCYTRHSALPSEVIRVGYAIEHNRHLYVCFYGFTLIESIWNLAINTGSVFFCTGRSAKTVLLPPSFITSTAHLNNQPTDASEMEGKYFSISVSSRRDSVSQYNSCPFFSRHNWQ